LKETTRIATVYIVAFLMGAMALAVTVRQFTRGCKLSPKLCCIANLKQIDGAKNTWALEYQKMTNDVPGEADLFGTNTNHYIKIKPMCAAGGMYTLGPVSDRPKCSIPEHNVW
jgi:hypothetical protein